jgi:predicted metal-dependent hydrolase
MHQIKVSDILIDVVRKDIKNLHLAVYPPTGRVRIATPLKLDDEAVRLFAISKLAWIKKHQKSFQSQERQTVREYISGESHYFEGNRYLLNVVYQQGQPRVEISKKTHIDLYVKAGSNLEQRQKVLTDWYRQNLKDKVPPLLEKWQKTTGVEINDWQIRQMKTKWGSCKISNKRIWLNLELIKKPTHCLEYIIVHELVHLLERHHNDRFISLMDKFLPQWRYCRDELNHFILSSDCWSY